MWIEVTGILVNKALAEIGIDTTNSEEHVRHYFNTDCIESFRELLDDDSNVIPNEVIVYTKGNGSFVLKHGYEEFKTMIQ